MKSTSVYLDTKLPIIDRGFFKMWEMIKRFDLVDDSSNFISAHLIGDKGSFAQAVMAYREKYHGKKSGKDNHYFVDYALDVKTSVDSDLVSNKKVHVPKTYELGKLDAKLVTANGGYEWINPNVQEQEIIPMLVEQIKASLKIQKKGGDMVIMVTETYTLVTVKLITLLKNCYKNCFIFKPLLSDDMEPERYIVCKEFRLSEKDRKDVIDKLNSFVLNDDRQLSNIEPSFVVDSTLMATMAFANAQIANRQVLAVNATVSFIKGENYYGDVYQNSRNEQIKMVKYWTDTFLTDKWNSGETSDLVDKNRDNVAELYNIAGYR